VIANALDFGTPERKKEEEMGEASTHRPKSEE